MWRQLVGLAHILRHNNRRRTTALERLCKPLFQQKLIIQQLGEIVCLLPGNVNEILLV